MNIAMKMTLDGLVRALRWQLHDLAEEAERGYARTGRILTTQRPVRVDDAPDRARGEGDDRAGR